MGYKDTSQFARLKGMDLGLELEKKKIVLTKLSRRTKVLAYGENSCMLRRLDILYGRLRSSSVIFTLLFLLQGLLQGQLGWTLVIFLQVLTLLKTLVHRPI